MPMIDQLPPAVSVSDGDEVALSQSGIVRSATRAQLLAGVQAALAAPQGTLLGRMSAGLGAPEIIQIGANLTLAQGALSAPAAFAVSALSAAAAPQTSDLVAMAQGGENVAAAYGQFMAGLSQVPGIDGSGLVASIAGAPAARRIADLFADAVTIETFGAAGDGVTDDTAAFLLALASGLPLVLGGRVYAVNGQLSARGNLSMLGVRGATVLRRIQASSVGAWISVAGPACFVEGVIFDAGSLVGDDAPCVYVTAGCGSAVFAGCQFLDCAGATQGTGLLFDCAPSAQHSVADCIAEGNGFHGISAGGNGVVTVTRSLCQNNGGDGIAIAAGTASRLVGNICLQNRCGVSVGTWGVGGPPAESGVSCVVSGNRATGNAQWGLAVAANGAAVIENTVGANGTAAFGGGILARIATSRLGGNVVQGGAVGLDCRGSLASLVAGNHVSDAGVGVLAGGCNNLRIGENYLASNGIGISISGIEPLVSATPTSGVTVDANWIGFSTAQSVGVLVADGTQGAAVTRNAVNGYGSALGSQALWLHTDSAIVEGNSWNNIAQSALQSSSVDGLPALVLPEVADDVLVTSAPPGIFSLLTQHQVDTLGQVMFLRVMNGGSGYTTASVSLEGSGTGASAEAVVSGGQIVWLMVTNPGSGYGAIGSPLQVSISGDGTGATATGSVGLPVLAGRRLRLTCHCAVRLMQSGSMPPLQNWTGYDMSIPAGGAVELEGVQGQWRAVQSPPVDYLLPTGDGGAVLQSVGSGNVTVRPASGGSLTIASAGEPGGYNSCLGRGSPEGVLAAAPGSDFRNLDGGAGNTLWIKLSGSGSSGWAAIA
jgi:hypothetical protein